MSNSIYCTSKSNEIKNFAGLSADVDELPTDVATGSSFFAIDTKTVYMFEATTETWYQL